LLVLAWPDRSDTTVASGGQAHTALVRVDGLISGSTEASAKNVIEALRKAFKDKNTVGVIVEINSPGGSPVQAGEIYDEIQKLRQQYPKIPIHAVASDVCASGGYYIAAAAQNIYANKASIVGSIGVRMDSFGFTDAIAKLGIERRAYTAGNNKDFLDPFKPVNPTEVQHLQGMLDAIHQQFIAAVKQGRGERLKDNPEVFSGLMWTGEQSVGLGLVDALGEQPLRGRGGDRREDRGGLHQAHPMGGTAARWRGGQFGRGAAEGMLEFDGTARVAVGLPAGESSTKGRDCLKRDRPLSQHRDPGRLQHPGEPDQRQADQAGGIVALQPLEQRDAQALGLETARALVRSLAPQISLDHCRRQRAKYDPERFHRHLLALAAGAIEQAQPGIKSDRRVPPPAAVAPLPASDRRACRSPRHPTPRPDPNRSPAPPVRAGDGTGFHFRQPRRTSVVAGSPGKAGFIDIRRLDGERQPSRASKLAAERRSGSQNQTAAIGQGRAWRLVVNRMEI
jgi:signal peptide peptidase SppA